MKLPIRFNEKRLARSIEPHLEAIWTALYNQEMRLLALEGNPVDPVEPPVVSGLYSHPTRGSELPKNTYNIPINAPVKIARVTNLGRSGEGSLPYILDQTGGDEWTVIVPEVSGELWLSESLTLGRGKVYFAGQAGPGHFVMRGNRPIWRADQGVWMHAAFAGGFGSNNDSFQVVRGDGLRVQNCSLWFGRDEQGSVDAQEDICERVSFVDCLTAFALEKGHEFGGIYFLDGAHDCSMYRCLTIGGRRRGLAGLENPCQVGIYGSVYVEPERLYVSAGCITLEAKEDKPAGIVLDTVGNVAIISPSSNGDEGKTADELSSRSDSRTTVSLYREGNKLAAHWDDALIDERYLGDRDEPVMEIGEPLPIDPLAFVLDHAGMTPADRHMVDLRAIEEALNDDVQPINDPFGSTEERRQEFVPVNDWDQLDEQGRRRLLVQLDDLHVEAGGISRFV